METASQERHGLSRRGLLSGAGKVARSGAVCWRPSRCQALRRARRRRAAAARRRPRASSSTWCTCRTG